MKTRASLLIASALLCLLFGCGGQSQPEKRSIRLSFWHILNYSGPREVMERAVARFEAEHPECEIAMEAFENDAYKMKLAVEVASGNQPDIFFTWGGGHLAEMVRSRKVLCLDSLLAENDPWSSAFLKPALELCRAEGGVYALPLDLSVVQLWCNPKLFREQGLEYPRTVKEFLDVCVKFREAGIVPCALGNRTQWPGAFYFCYLANRIGGTELFLRGCADNAVFAGPDFVRAGEMLRQLISARAFPVGFNGIDDAQARASFVNGRAAMYLMGSWLAARVMTERPEFLDEMTPIPFPVVPDGKGDPSCALAGVNAAFAVSSTCRHPELAQAFLQCLTSEAVVSEWCAIGRIPAIRTTPEQEKSLPRPTRLSLQALREASSLQPYYDQYLEPRMAVRHKETTQKLFAGTMTPAEAAAEMGRPVTE